MSNENQCDARETNEICCLHDVVHAGEPSRVCCWCGDLYQPHTHGLEHGEYLPGGAADCDKTIRDLRQKNDEEWLKLTVSLLERDSLRTRVEVLAQALRALAQVAPSTAEVEAIIDDLVRPALYDLVRPVTTTTADTSCPAPAK